MSETLKACPACGTTEPVVATAHYHWVGCYECSMQGPHVLTRAEAVERWNALPRRDWHPAADPPHLPPGSAGVYVWAERSDGRCHPWWYTGAGDLLWPDVRRWHGMPGADGGDGPRNAQDAV